MKKYLILAVLAVASLGLIAFNSFGLRTEAQKAVSFGLSTLTVPQGGTGAATLTGCLEGNGTGAITGNGAACGSGSGSAFPFTSVAGYNSTSTAIGFLNGLFSTASSTFSGVTKFTNTGTTTFAGPISLAGYPIATTTTVCIYPEHCNFQADGVADDVTFTNASNAVYAQGGGTVYIKKGQYNFSGMAQMSTSTDWVGEGPATQINITTAGVGILALAVSDAGLYNMQLRDATTLATPSITSYALVQYKNVHNMKFKDILVTNANGFGIFVVSTANATTSNVEISDSFFYGNGHQDLIGGGPESQGNSTTTDIRITNTYLEHTLLSGGTLNSDVDANCVDIVQTLGVVFSDNTCYGRVVLGTEKYPNTSTIISGNVIDAPFGLTKISGSIIVEGSGATTSQQILVQNNILKNGSVYVQGISGTPNQHVIVSGNTIQTSLSTYQGEVGECIKFDYVSNSRVENNDCTAGDTTDTAIVFTNTTNSTAAHNSLKDFASDVNLNSGSGNKAIFNDNNNIASPTANTNSITMSGGNVGIATSSPSAKLSIKANTDANTGRAFVVSNNSGTDKFVVLDNGNVGIGISPATLFHLSGSASNIYVGNQFLMDNTAQAAGTGARIALGGVYTGTSQQAFATVAGLKLNSIDNDYSGVLAFSTRANGSTMNEVGRFDQVGNFGIGSTTPWKLLSVGSSNTGTFAISTSTDGCATFTKGELYSTGSACGSGVGGGIGDPFTHPATGVSATTSLMLFNGNASTTALSATTAWFNSFNATSTIATSTIAAAGLWMGPSYDSTYDNLLTLKPGRTYGNSSASAVKEGVLNIDGTSSGRILLNVMQGSGAGAGSSPYMANIQNQSTSATGIMLKIKTASTQFSGNLGISVQGKQAPAIELNEDIWNGGLNNQGQGLFQMNSHDNAFRIDSRNNTNTGYCSDFIMSGNFATTTYGKITLFNCTSSAGNSAEGSGRFNLFGTSTVTNLVNFTSLQGATEGDLFVVKQAGNVGVGTSSPSAKLSVKAGSDSGSGRAFVLSNSSGVEKFAIADNGNLGVGIFPTTLFQLSGSASNIYVGNQFLMDDTAQAAGTGARIALGGTYDGTTAQQAFATVAGLKLNSTSGNFSGVLAFSTRVNGGAMSEKVRITDLGNMGIATTSPWRTLSVVGTMAVNGLTAGGAGDDDVCMNPTTFDFTDANASTCIVSSIRFKENLDPLKNSLDKVLKLNAVGFNYKPEMDSSLVKGKKRVGLIAEDMEKVEPRLVNYEEDGTTPRGIDYESYTALLTGAIQDLNDKIEGKAVIVGQVKRSVEEDWQWIVIGLLVMWNLALTFKRK